MVADLTAAPAGSVVLLHGCAHNPTGIDPTEAQWGELAALCASRQLLPFFDVAYQGFASGSLEKDAFAPRLFASRGLELLVAQSYSKNMGLYCERVGALSVLLSDKAAVQPVLGQLKRIARAMYSNPPAHGARLVAEILGDAELSEAWTVELAAMAGRIHSVRVQLYEALCALNPSHNWRFVMDQIGMFSFTGLTPAQVENMTARHKIFMTKDGRISLAGLSSAKVPLVAAALDDSIKNH
jgi:aspartate aminotransferase, chloroplastic